MAQQIEELTPGSDVALGAGKAELTFGPREIEKVWFDPHCRFPDRDPADNVWPREEGEGIGMCQ